MKFYEWDSVNNIFVFDVVDRRKVIGMLFFDIFKVFDFINYKIFLG